MSQLVVKNHGPLIMETNYWDTVLAEQGMFFLTINAGAFRLLVPPSQESALAEMRTASEVVVSIGPWTEQNKQVSLEILFEDGSDSPFAIFIGTEQCDRIPLVDSEKQWIFTAWTQPRRKGPHKAMEKPAYLRKVPQIPFLEPRKS